MSPQPATPARLSWWDETPTPRRGAPRWISGWTAGGDFVGYWDEGAWWRRQQVRATPIDWRGATPIALRVREQDRPTKINARPIHGHGRDDGDRRIPVRGPPIEVTESSPDPQPVRGVREDVYRNRNRFRIRS